MIAIVTFARWYGELFSVPGFSPKKKDITRVTKPLCIQTQVNNPSGAIIAPTFLNRCGNKKFIQMILVKNECKAYLTQHQITISGIDNYRQ